MPHFHAASPDGDVVVSLPELLVIAGGLRELAGVLGWARQAANLVRLMDEWDRGNPVIKVRRPVP